MFLLCDISLHNFFPDLTCPLDEYVEMSHIVFNFNSFWFVTRIWTSFLSFQKGMDKVPPEVKSVAHD